MFRHRRISGIRQAELLQADRSHLGGSSVRRNDREKAFDQDLIDFGGVPTILWRVCTHPDRHNYDLSTVSAVSYGGAPPPLQLQEMVRETWEISHLTLLVQTFPAVEEALQVVSETAASAYAAAKAKSVRA